MKARSKSGETQQLFSRIDPNNTKSGGRKRKTVSLT